MADQIHSAETELSVLVPEVWSARIYEVLLAKLPFNASISRDYEGEISDLGDTVRISSVPEFDDATELAEGARSDADAVTVTQQSLVINKRLVKDFIITKKAMMQSIDVMNNLREHAAFAIMKKMQSIIIAAIVPSASAPDHQIAYDSGTTLALADILEAKELLDEQDVSESGRRGLVDVPQYNDLFNITGFTSRDFVPSGSPITQGAFATPFLGFDVDWTSELANDCYFFSPEFMSLAIQQNMDVREYDLGVDGKRANRINTDLLFGLKQLDDKRVVKIG